MPVKIFVGNISDGAKSRDLQALFEKYGKVVECDIVRNFGFVHMDDEEDAKAAVAALDGHMFVGNRVGVELSHGKRRGGGGGGFRGSRGGGRYPPRGGGSYGGRSDYGRSYDRSSRYDPYDRRDSGRDRYPPPSRDRYGPPSSSRYPSSYDRRSPPPPSRDYYRDRSPVSSRPPPEYYASRRSPPRYR